MANLCSVFGINRSRYYDHLKRRDQVDPAREQLKYQVIQLHAQSRGSMGARTLSAALKAQNQPVGRFLAGRLMSEAGLCSRQRRPSPYRHSVVQSKYIWAGTHWLYLAAVLDLYARRIVGWAISTRPDSMLTCKALALAYEARGRPEKVMFHSDQGCPVQQRNVPHQA